MFEAGSLKWKRRKESAEVEKLNIAHNLREQSFLGSDQNRQHAQLFSFDRSGD